jgi:hypothetical protein
MFYDLQKMKLIRCFNKYIRAFAEVMSLMISTPLHPRREWASSVNLHLRVPVGNPALINLNLPLTALIGVTKRKRKILTCTQMKQNHKKQKLERLHSTRLIRRDPKATNSRHVKASSEITDSGLLAPTTNHF